MPSDLGDFIRLTDAKLQRAGRILWVLLGVAVVGGVLMYRLMQAHGIV